MHSLSRNASRLLTDSASRYPERIAIVFGDDRITYEPLDAAANRGRTCSSRAGSSPGTRSRCPAPILQHLRESTGCTKSFLIESGGAPWSGHETPEAYTSVVAEQPVTFRTAERDEDDTAVVLCTSGTTGHPKGLFVSRGQRPATC